MASDPLMWEKIFWVAVAVFLVRAVVVRLKEQLPGSRAFFAGRLSFPAAIFALVWLLILPTETAEMLSAILMMGLIWNEALYTGPSDTQSGG